MVQSVIDIVVKIIVIIIIVFQNLNRFRFAGKNINKYNFKRFFLKQFAFFNVITIVHSFQISADMDLNSIPIEFGNVFIFGELFIKNREIRKEN